MTGGSGFVLYDTTDNLTKSSGPWLALSGSSTSVLACSKHASYLYSTNKDDGASQLGASFRAADPASKYVVSLQERWPCEGNHLLSSILLRPHSVKGTESAFN